MDFFEVLLSDEDSKKEEKKTEEEPKIINEVFGCDLRNALWYK